MLSLLSGFLLSLAACVLAGAWLVLGTCPYYVRVTWRPWRQWAYRVLADVAQGVFLLPLLATLGLFVWAASLGFARGSDVAPVRPWAEQDRRAGLSRKAAAEPASFEIDETTVFVVDGKAVPFAEFVKLEGLVITSLEVKGTRAVRVEAKTGK